MLRLCFKLLFQLFGRTIDMPVIYEKVKSVCFIYMQTQKVKFKFVQINMKQVSLILLTNVCQWLIFGKMANDKRLSIAILPKIDY